MWKQILKKRSRTIRKRRRRESKGGERSADDSNYDKSVKDSVHRSQLKELDFTINGLKVVWRMMIDPKDSF